MAALLPLGSVLTLIAMLTYVLVTLWPINRPLHTLYPLVLLYAAWCLPLVDSRLSPPATRDSCLPC